MRIVEKLMVCLLLAAGLSACGTLPAHNNTLIFAVKRDVGVGVSGPSAANTGVDITLGYKERQVAWVPIWANGKDGAPMPCDRGAVVETTGSGTKTVAQAFTAAACNHGPKLLADGDSSSSGNSRPNDPHDALSTFASFGGDLGASAGSDATGAREVSGRIASFFATGIAAQNLSKQTGLVSSVHSAEANKQKEDADAAAQSKKKEDRTAQIGSVVGFLKLTRLDDGNVRPACVNRLADEAVLGKDARDALPGQSATPPMTLDEWKAAAEKAAGPLAADLPFLARRADANTSTFNKALEDGADGKSRKSVANSFCPEPK